MRSRAAIGLVCMAGGVGAVAQSATGQQSVYDNAATFVAWWGQAPPGAAAGPEGGDEVMLGAGGRQVLQFEFWYQVGGATTSGAADVRARFYANDGPGLSPGTLLWDSGVQADVPHISGSNHLALAVPGAVVPDTLTWTVEFTNRTGSTGEALGLRIYDPPIVGSSDPGYFWLREAGGAFMQAWFGGITPANFGARVTVQGSAFFQACCLPDGTCAVATPADCYLIGGASLPGSCTNPCPAFGACCFGNGWCLELTEQGCIEAGGAWLGAPILCASAPCAQPLHNNGPLATGKMRTGGQHAPYDTYWSDVYTVGGCQTQFIGYNADQGGGFRHADNFTIAPLGGWDVDALHIYSFIAGGSAAMSPVSGATLRIWSGQPGLPGSSIVWGDTTTDRLTSSAFTRIFKFSTSYPVFRHRLEVGATLLPGEYWIDYALHRSPPGSVYAPLVTLPNALGKPGADAIYSTDGGEIWQPVVDEPHPPASCPPVPQDFPFSIIGVELPDPPCYANCDESSNLPILNVDDFTCFINQFAAAQALPTPQQIIHYANCDQSTNPPILNVDDFTCFINAFAQGCP